jgi:hypothetical protein
VPGPPLLAALVAVLPVLCWANATFDSPIDSAIIVTTMDVLIIMFVLSPNQTVRLTDTSWEAPSSEVLATK